MSLEEPVLGVLVLVTEVGVSNNYILIFSSLFNVSVLPKVDRKPAEQEISFELKSGTIPGLQVSLVNGGRISISKKSTKHSRFALCYNSFILYSNCLNRDVCLNPQDDLFNWTVKKDPKGTKKFQLPTLIVTSPSATVKAMGKRKKKLCKTCPDVSAKPKKLILSPDFWSEEETEKPRIRKKRILFKCRNDGCTDAFPSVRDRKMHERYCCMFDEVFLKTKVFSVVVTIVHT